MNATHAVLSRQATVVSEVHYVDVNSTNATPPYTTWTTAAKNIQDAVDAAVAGDEIVVTNGVYATGERAIDGVTTNRVAVDKPLALRSVNGPQFTAIDGGYSVRCVSLTNGARLSGFTLSNGYSYPGGGGASGGTLCDCTLAGNVCGSYAGGASGGGAEYCTLNNCTLSGNVAYGYGQPFAGGGAASCTLNNCTLTGNLAVATADGGSSRNALGGGAAYCRLNNCTLSDNSVTATQGSLGGPSNAYGGGAFANTLDNGTLVGNSAAVSGQVIGPSGGVGGGAFNCRMTNCIIYFNTNSAPQGTNYDSFSILNYCCTTPQPTSGVGNITNAPLFVDTNGWANLRLQSNSPCINAGNNSYVTNATDLDGNPRIAGGTVDIGAYEFQSPASMISYAWLQQFNLPINPATDTADPDGDGVNNYREWLAGSDPTNPFSFPPLLTLIPYGANVILTWPTNAVGFTLQSTTNLFSPVWNTNSPAPVVIGGQNVIINPRTAPQQFYRLKQ